MGWHIYSPSREPPPIPPGWHIGTQWGRQGQSCQSWWSQSWDQSNIPCRPRPGSRHRGNPHRRVWDDKGKRMRLQMTVPPTWDLEKPTCPSHWCSRLGAWRPWTSPARWWRRWWWRRGRGGRCGAKGSWPSGWRSTPLANLGTKEKATVLLVFLNIGNLKHSSRGHWGVNKLAFPPVLALNTLDRT